VLLVARLDNKTPHLAVMLDEARDLKIPLIVVGQDDCTNSTATNHRKKLQLVLEELSDKLVDTS